MPKPLNPGHLMVEVYEYKAEEMSEEHEAALLMLRELMKKDGRHPRQSREAALAKMDEKHRKVASEAHRMWKEAQYAVAGWKWRCRILHDGEEVYASPMAAKEQHQAYRFGQRYIRRYERNDCFDKPLGVSVSVN